MADFGMAVPYFVEIVELKEVTVTCGPGIARSDIGHIFGEQTAIVTGVTADGQAWRAIYPHETSECWILPDSRFGRSTVIRKS
jgi:hypothetical protein